MSLSRMRDGVFDQLGVSRTLNTPENSAKRKQLPGTALAGEPRYRNIVDNARIGIADVSIDGTIIYANVAALKMVEYDSLDELRKLNVIELWHRPEQRAEFISRLRHDGYVNNYEIEYLTRTGKITHALASAIVDGNMISQVLIDVTQRKRAAALEKKLTDDLRESLKELNCLFVVSNSVWMKNSFDEIFQDVVTAIPAGWRYPEVTRGKLHFEEKEWVSESFEETEWKLSSDIIVNGKRCGSVDAYYLEERPPLDEGPFMLEERKLLDSIAHTLSEVLERRNAEEKLRQSQKMEALGILSGGIAHDFNNLLYPIIVNANLLLENHKADGEEYAMLGDIVEASLKAKDLVSQILVFGRRGDGIDRIHDFVSVADEAMKLVRPALSGTISIKQDFPNSTIPVLCNSSQLYQVVVNLFTNAQQAISDNGEIKITLDTVAIENLVCIHGTLPHGMFARLTMTDNGVGMDDETREKMFDPFFTTKEAGQGTGLGLSTVFGIVQTHGGGIIASSELGIGTTIVVYLPLADDIRERSSDATIASPVDTNNEHILLVDDVESIRKSVKACLQQSGYDVTTVSSGQEALEAFQKYPDHFDLIMTDQSMPKMSGKELSINLLKIRPNLPIIICSGYSDAIAPESISKSGIRAFLQKPASPSALRRVVRRVLDETKRI